jgi:O-antigen/teichoic acid export membrane protein
MLFRNTMAQSASFGLGYLYSFLLAPFMIARLGLDAFGIWAVTGAFASYAGLLDLGIGMSLSRFVAVYDAEDDERSIRECIGFGLMVVISVGLLAAVVAASLASVVSDQLGVLGTDQMRLILLASVAIWTCNGLTGVFNAIGIGKREMVPPNIANAIGASINFAFSIAILVASTSLTAYAGVNSAAALISTVPALLAMRHIWKGPYLARPSLTLIREILGFSVKNQLSWIANLINFQTDKLIIAFMVDVHAAAVYEIGSRVVIAVRSLSIMSASALTATAAARMVEEGVAVIESMYKRYLPLVCATAFPLFALAAVTAPFLLVAWLKAVPGEASAIVPVLCAAYLVDITTGVATTLSVGYGAPGLAASNAVAIAVLNIVFTVALAPLLGLWGVVLGTAFAVVIGSSAFNVRFLRMFELPAREFWKGVGPPAVLALGLAIPPGLLALAVGTPASRAPAIGLLAAAVAMYAPAYWVLASRRGLLPAQLAYPLRRRRASAPGV